MGGEGERVAKQPSSDSPGHLLPSEDISRTSKSTEGDTDAPRQPRQVAQDLHQR